MDRRKRTKKMPRRRLDRLHIWILRCRCISLMLMPLRSLLMISSGWSRSYRALLVLQGSLRMCLVSPGFWTMITRSEFEVFEQHFLRRGRETSRGSCSFRRARLQEQGLWGQPLHQLHCWRMNSSWSSSKLREPRRLRWRVQLQLKLRRSQRRCMKSLYWLWIQTFCIPHH